MPRIRCHHLDCVFLDEGYCSAAAVEFDPDSGCVTYSPSVGENDGDDWEDSEELEEWDEIDEDDDDDSWIDEENNY